jgi:hypothetical protein
VADARRQAGVPDDDPDLLAWERHLAELRRNEAAGGADRG